ncbi:MAG: CorA family divalent cation transporter [Eubacterium sp.]|nr:CorA family divalent cation transporter [Eubacterium sp.]
MEYYFKNQRLAACDCSEKDRQPGRIGIFEMVEALGHAGDYGMTEEFLEKILKNNTLRFESHEGMDFLCVSDMGEKRRLSAVYIFIKGDGLFIATDIADDIQALLENYEGSIHGIGNILFIILDDILEGDKNALEGIEEQITTLENEVITDRGNKNPIKKIIALRKNLRQLKHYYEQLVTIFSYIEANENDLVDRKSLKLLKILSGKVDRLHSNVLTLIEYVSQIREAYQAEVDIQLNSTMKIFTVITTIFFPLSLIAGWYGMNFRMPEYNSPFGYPMVILLSVMVVAGSIYFFKKNRWF